MSIFATIQRAKAEEAICPAPEYIGRPYRPGSGTEGMAFDELWCDHCARDAAYREAGEDADPAIACQILSDTLVYSVTDPEYPKEWVYDRNGVPCCTAFTTDPTKPVRCNKTLDLFAALTGNREGETGNG